MSLRERPILFSAPMVRAILSGAKSQTRRIVKPGPGEDFGALECGYYHPTVIDKRGEEQPGRETFGAWTRDGEYGWRCPYGQPGDRLWVREAWMQLYESDDDGGLTCLPPTGESAKLALRRAKYRADGEKPAGFAANWKPSIHMPRWASRITLEVTGVRVERLQDISEADAEAEGCAGGAAVDPSEEYAALWNSINGPGAWDANPWVWCVEFRRTS